MYLLIMLSFYVTDLRLKENGPITQTMDYCRFIVIISGPRNSGQGLRVGRIRESKLKMSFRGVWKDSLAL